MKKVLIKDTRYDEQIVSGIFRSMCLKTVCVCVCVLTSNGA